MACMDVSQPSMPPLARRVHEDSLCEATSELTVSNSVLELMPNLNGAPATAQRDRGQLRDHRAAKALATAGRCGRVGEVSRVLLLIDESHTLVRSEGKEGPHH